MSNDGCDFALSAAYAFEHFEIYSTIYFRFSVVAGLIENTIKKEEEETKTESTISYKDENKWIKKKLRTQNPKRYVINTCFVIL